MSYQFHPEAEAKHLDTVAYYELQQPGLGASYLTDFELTLEKVCQAPHRYPVEHRPDIRRIGLRKFPLSYSRETRARLLRMPMRIPSLRIRDSTSRTPGSNGDTSP